VSQRLRIAVADDERDIREYLQEVLPRLGHEVVAACASGRELVERCRAAPPDLAILDIKMPELDGIEAALALNRERPTPVLLLTAHHDDELMARAGASHVLGYLVKPVKEGDLKAAITLAASRFRQMQDLAREAGELRQALEERKLVERAKGAVMRRLHVDEEEAFRKLRKLSSRRNRKLIDVARDLLDAEEVFHQFDDL
jgi:AmiR/NasT family two-component response regulator